MQYDSGWRHEDLSQVSVPLTTHHREMIPMSVDGDELILQRLRDDFPDWSIGRTRDAEGRPNWWTAKRKRQLTRREEYKGLSLTLYGDTAGLLRDQLDKQAEKAATVAAEPAAWNPAYL
jgi:hypothetical protein